MLTPGCPFLVLVVPAAVSKPSSSCPSEAEKRLYNRYCLRDSCSNDILLKHFITKQQLF